MKTCKTCAHWDRTHKGALKWQHPCLRGDSWKTTQWLIETDEPYSTGRLYTGKDFGCVNHQTIV